MGQLDLFDRAPAVTEQAVWLRCPQCSHEWHSATVREGAWWSGKLEDVAKRAHCQCGQSPPMRVARVEER